MITINNENYLSFKESATLLGISLMTIRRWIEEGKLKPYKISARKIFLKESDIKEMFK
jgi:excisionase family DNA binding protein